MARRAAAAIVAAVGVGLLAAAVLYLAPELEAEAEFRAVSDAAKPAAAASDGDAGERGAVDWEYLDSLSPDVVAYLTVDNTNVDYPVAQSSDNSYYLWRGLDGQQNGTGTPYMDYRCESPDSGNVIVYGHHMGTTHTVFDALSGAHEQGWFDGLGTVHWTTRDGGTTDFKPAFAMRVYQDYGKLFRFDFGDASPHGAPSGGDGAPPFTEWLASLLADASASCSDAAALSGHATRSLTLVTCSEQQGGQPWRCLLVCLPEPKLAL